MVEAEDVEGKSLRQMESHVFNGSVCGFGMIV